MPYRATTDYTKPPCALTSRVSVQAVKVNYRYLQEYVDDHGTAYVYYRRGSGSEGAHSRDTWHGRIPSGV